MSRGGCLRAVCRCGLLAAAGTLSEYVAGQVREWTAPLLLRKTRRRGRRSSRSERAHGAGPRAARSVAVKGSRGRSWSCKEEEGVEPRAGRLSPETKGGKLMAVEQKAGLDARERAAKAAREEYVDTAHHRLGRLLRLRLNSKMLQTAPRIWSWRRLRRS